MQKAIVNLLVDTVNDYLTTVLTIDVDVNDSTRAGKVQPGLLQDDPTRYRVNVLTYPNDPNSDSAWKHELVVLNSNGANYNPPPYEIGGGEMWYRRFVTEVEMFYKTKVKRSEARELSGVILARTERAIATSPIAELTDDFGETALQMYVISSLISQGGGEGQAIWHARIWWQVLTGKEF